MNIKIKNIGMIQEADIKIDGITVIAGENDSGKSTVSKMLFSLIKSDNMSWNKRANSQQAKAILAIRLNLVFDANVTDNGEVILFDKDKEFIKVNIENRNKVTLFERKKSNERFFDSTFISNPVVFDLLDFFSSVAKMKERQTFEYGLDFDVKYPYLMWDLYDKLTKSNPFKGSKREENIQKMIATIINGEFIFENNDMSFMKSSNNKLLKVEMFNTATGIKSFGILQMLNKNRFLNNKNLIIIDEPEVHLHPKWEIKMAKLIVLLAKKGIKVIINSHSPYMIQAIYKFSKEENIQNITNFYLTEVENNKSKIIHKNNDMNSIFSKLSQPLQELVWGK